MDLGIVDEIAAALLRYEGLTEIRCSRKDVLRFPVGFTVGRTAMMLTIIGMPLFRRV
jgi:hypothetical protein